MKTEESQQTAENYLGQILREKRQFLKMEILEISTYLKIKSRDIEAIENDDLKHVTKHLYVPGLIRSYAKFLKIDPKLIEEKIKVLPIASNTENKKHQLLNIGESNQLSPDKDSVFNFLLIAILLFLALLSLYNSFQNNDALITNQKLIHELENIDS
jgi:cytoskeletal protein RodZ